MKKTVLCGYLLLLLAIVFLGCLPLYTDVRKISLTARYPSVIIARRAGCMQGTRYGNWIVVPPVTTSLYVSHLNLFAMGAYTVLVKNNHIGY